MESYDLVFPDEITERDLPPCEVERLDDILMVLKAPHPTIRSKILRDLASENGAYIVKLLDLFDVCELDDDKAILHRMFDIFYALIELCDRKVIEILLNDSNFLSVVGVFGYNPGLIREMDFRTELEGKMGFKEVIPIDDKSVLERVHMNFRIQVIKDNVLSRSLPDCSVIMLEHMVNENNYYILSYISDSEDYWQAIKQLLRTTEKRLDDLGLLREIIQLVRVTRPLDKLPQPRRDGFGAPPVFGTLINNLFGDGSIFEAFCTIFGSPDSKPEEIAVALDILNILVFYQGPERVRAYLASEGKCIASPTSDNDRIVWKPGSSLFTALLFVFERHESSRIQMLTLLREIFRVPLGHDDKFLSVLYPNYINWLLQPLKYSSANDTSSMFALQDSIMELLTFCTENHGYRVKYLFGRQPIASYVEKMLRSRNKLFVIHAIKFVRSCVARTEAFFSRFLIQNDLFTPVFANLKLGKRNDGAVGSAVLELLALIEKANLTSLIEHIYTKFYPTYKEQCPLVFDAIRVRYEDSFGTQDVTMELADQSAIKFVKQNSIDAEEELYWEKDTESEGLFVPSLVNSGVSEEEVKGRSTPPMKLVNYDDDDDDDKSPTSLNEGDVTGNASSTSDETFVSDASYELKLPIRENKEEDESKSFLNGGGINVARKQKVAKNAKSMFQKITWKVKKASPTSSSSTNETVNGCKDGNSNSTNDDVPHDPTDECEEHLALIAKRKLELEEAQTALKKAKTCTPISSS